MVRATIIDKDGVKRGAWSSEEDDKLRAYVQKYGPWKWRELPRLAGLTRCGKSCRLRWLNYLRPGLKRGNYTNEEDGLIRKLHKKYGNKWSTIAAKLPGRTDNEIKNHWNAHLKKQMREKSEATTQPKQKQLSPNVEAGTDNFTDFSSTTFGILESSSLSQQTLSTSTSTSSDGDGDLLGVNWEVEDYDPIIYQDFWNEPFILDRDNVGHVLDGSLQFSADCVMFSPQHETTYEDYMDLFCFLP